MKRFWDSVHGWLDQLHRRGVYPALAAYAVVAWVILQVGEVTFEPLGIPGWALTGLVVVVIVGFPVVVVVAWMFDITPRGLRRDRRDAAQTFDRRPSLAVLPFIDLGGRQDQQYFCEGVAEAILNALTKVERLRVAARSLSFRLHDPTADVRRTGRQLNVDAVLQGNVRKSDERLHVSAELVNVADGCALWSTSFDRQLDDVFTIQDEIARSIAHSLLQTLTPGQQSALKTASSQDVRAYDYYLRGRQFIRRFRKTDLESAIHMFRQAIRRDETFALAWAGYADCHSLLLMYADPQGDYKQEAVVASERALALDPNLAEAQASVGLACLVNDQFGEAERHLRRALELNPQLYEAYYYYGRAKFHQGELVTAAEWFRRAAEVDPADYQARCLRVQILRGLGRLDEARKEAEENIAVLEKHMEWNPDDVRALHLGCGSLIIAGRTDQARAWLRRALQVDPNDSILLYNVACNYATLGDVDAALDHLESAVDNGMVSLGWMLNDTDLENVRGEPRFAALIARLRDTEQRRQDDAAGGSATGESR